jgi:5-methylcytosine-specific restriction endonuclease McrA
MDTMSNSVEGWTDAKYWSFIRSALRRSWNRFPNKFRALNAAKLPKKGVRKGRKVFLYECEGCKGEFTTSQVTVDHISPCGSLRGWDDLVPFTSSLFCEVDNLQVLCKKCHHEKTMAERGIDPRMANFKKLKASKQKELLTDLKLREGSNAKERIDIYQRWLDEQ